MNKDNKVKILIITLITAIIMGISSITIYSNICAPKFYDYFIDTGVKYLMDGKYEEAILAFNKSIEIEEKSTKARVYLAKGYVGNNEYDKAIEVLEEAQNLDITSEELLKEILNILNEIDADIAYEFLDRFINAIGKDNISGDINKIFDSAMESPSVPLVDPEPGTYIKPISIKLKLDEIKVGHSFYYTTDGSEPSKSSQKYRGKIDIGKTTAIKLIGYNKNDESTEVTTLNYVIDKEIVNEIKDSIKEAEDLISNTNIGTEVGEISEDNRDRLQFKIEEAKDLINKESPSYKDISTIKNKIENGIIVFKDNIIKPVDKSKLESAISQANNLYNHAIEGNQKGQYKLGSKSTLMNAIDKSKKIYNNSSAKQDEIDLATSSLNSSISTFKNKKITQSDRNSDGSYTREYVEDYVKRTEADYSSLKVWGPSDDKMHNGELCYFVSGQTMSTNASGFTRGIEFFIGSKTLQKYTTYEVAW